MVPLNGETMMMQHEALEAFQRGEVEAGLALLDEYAYAYALQLDASTPFEVLVSLAGTAKVLEAAKLYELAALKYQDACAYAEIREPGTSRTAGDYSDLAAALERIGDFTGALQALEKSADHLKVAGAWQPYSKPYEQRMNWYRERIASQTESKSKQNQVSPRSKSTPT